jgi:hypothetical protein
LLQGLPLADMGEQSPERQVGSVFALMYRFFLRF